MTEGYIDNFLNDALPKLRIAVVGDIMVDRYVFGSVDRISSVLGGAANVAANLANLDCRVYLAGLVGDDENAALLRGLLNDAGIDGTGMVVRKGHVTTTKVRVLGSRQQMVRLDFEDAVPFERKEEDALAAWLDQRIAQGLDGMILSDYKKGVLTDRMSQLVIERARRAGIPVLVDPKGSDWHKYNGADFVTPNIKELGDCCGEKIPNEGQAVVDAARRLPGRAKGHRALQCIVYLAVTQSCRLICGHREQNLFAMPFFLLLS